MNQNKQIRLLLASVVVLFVLNALWVYMLFRAPGHPEQQAVENIQHRLDSLSLWLSGSTQRIDTLMLSLERSEKQIHQLDAQVTSLTGEYEKNRVASRERLDGLRKDLRLEQKKLESMQKELLKLEP